MSLTITTGDEKCSIELFLPEAPAANPYTTLIAEKPEIKYGADDIDNESIFFPGTLKIQLYSNYPNMLDYLHDPNCSISLYENDSLLFTGYIDIEDIELALSDSTYSLTFIDQSRPLKHLPASELTSLSGNSSPVLITTIMQTILNEISVTLQNSVPDSYINASSSETGPIGLSRMAVAPEILFTGINVTALDILKSIVVSLGLVGYFMADKFIVKPRFAPVTPISFDDSTLDDGAEISPVAGYDYVEFLCKESDTGETWGHYVVSDTRIDPTEDGLNPLEQWMYFPGGTVPGVIEYNPVHAKDSLYDIYYETEAGSYTVNGSDEGALVELLGDLTANRVVLTRRKMRAKSRLMVDLFDIFSYRGRDYIVTEAKRGITDEITQFNAISI